MLRNASLWVHHLPTARTPVYFVAVKSSLFSATVIALLCACDGPAAPGLLFGDVPDGGTQGAPPPANTVDAGLGGQGTPGPPIDCPELTRCMATCSGSTCGPRCLERADTRTQEIYSWVSACAARHECRTPECIQTECAEEWLDCQQNIHPDERLTCEGLRRCLQVCQLEPDCSAACENLVQPSVRSSLDDLVNCGANHECIGDEDCLRTACEPELIACYPEGAHLRLSCHELIRCIGDCQADIVCQSYCRREARFQALADLEALDNCQIGCSDDEDACRILCAREFAVCGP